MEAKYGRRNFAAGLSSGAFSYFLRLLVCDTPGDWFCISEAGVSERGAVVQRKRQHRDDINYLSNDPHTHSTLSGQESDD